jgi:flagellar protein FliL
MADDATEQQPGDAPAKARNPMIPVALAVLIGLVAGGATGAFVVGPALASGIAPTADAAELRGAHAQSHSTAAGATSEDEEEPAEEEPKGKEKEGGASAPTYLLDNIVLNPANSGGTRFLLLSVSFELKSSAVSDEMKQRDAEVRDAVLKLLGGKTVEQLTDIGTREALKEELRLAVAKLFRKQNAVKRVYFPQFVIQ